uniref:Uncharacterized protein n=1 Tax=Clandestinovirus TaxID=2831644 RepID=A0A8F8KQL9_9VIRU|nr:hypothetical protein KOM_12_124 [Clandestinovirus]
MNQYFEVLCSESPNRIMHCIDYAYGEKDRVSRHYNAMFPEAVRLTPLDMIDHRGDPIGDFSDLPTYLKYHPSQSSKYILIAAKNVMEAKQVKPNSELILVNIKNLSVNDTLTQTSDALAHLRLEVALLENRLRSTVTPIVARTTCAGKRDALRPMCMQCKQPVADYWEHYDEGGYWRCK